MRATGQTWTRIAENEGYPSARAAMKAVARHRERNPIGSVERVRYDAAEAYRITKATLFGVMASARSQGTLGETIAAARAINDTVEKQTKLLGAQVPVAQQVDVTVTADPAAVIDRMEAELLALAAQRPTPALGGHIIEGEVIE